MTTVLAVDLGSASGRVLAGTLHDGRLDVTDIHRFKHEARRREDGTLTWDVATMEAETITGLKKALEQFPDARAVSIDTWGVDWAPLDENGELVGDVIAYRDERTSRTLDAFRDRIGDREFFDLTGNQPATINTANQLFAYLQENPADAQRVAAALFLPDYFAYRLTASSAGRVRSPRPPACSPRRRRLQRRGCSTVSVSRAAGSVTSPPTVPSSAPARSPASKPSPSCAAVPTILRAPSTACPLRKVSAPTSCPAAPGPSSAPSRTSPS